MNIPVTRSQRLQMLSFVAALLCLLVSGTLEYWGLARMDTASTTNHSAEAVLADAADDMREKVLELRRYEKDVFMNVGSDADVRDYHAKWDLALQGLRFDLVRARHAGSTPQDAELQQVVDQIAAYRAGFTNIYEAILSGAIRTTQQANLAMSPFKNAVHEAELLLGEMGGNHSPQASLLAPAVTAQRLGLAATLLSFLTLAVVFAGWIRRPSTVSAPEAVA